MRYLAYFVALAVSYWVMTLADKQQNLTKKVGKALSWLMLALLLIGPICKGIHHWKKCHDANANPACSMSGHGDGMGCPDHKGDAKDDDDDDDDSDDSGK